MGGNQGNYLEIVLTPSRGSDNAKISANKSRCSTIFVCFKKNERITQNSSNAIPCKQNMSSLSIHAEETIK